MSTTPQPQRPLESASLSWNEAGTPVSAAFDDVYFSNDNGLDETRYVFLKNNGLPERWASHPRPLFVIGETGFGTGLNFLASWQAFRLWLSEKGDNGAERLHFISFEKFPLTHADLAKALANWPELATLSAQLVANYPDPLLGCHRLLLDEGRVVLDLWFGDISDTLPLLADANGQGMVDAWFLDGFAPSKNPQMWNDDLFAGLARLARHGASLATFTCAGFVRRGLIAAGFAMQKVKGHGNKREMLAGWRDASRQPAPAMLQPRQAISADQGITLVGGGMASAALALALCRRGRQVTLLCQDPAPAMGASGNRQGALYPLLHAEADNLGQFYASAFGFARRSYEALLTRHTIPHDWCGVLQLAHDEKSARKQTRLAAAGFPQSLLRVLPPDEWETMAGVELQSHGDAPLLYYPQGGWICPQALTLALLAEAQATGRLVVQTGVEVHAIQASGSSWQLALADGSTKTASQLVLANGHGLSRLLPDLPLTAVRGEVSHQPTTAALSRLKTVLCYSGYLTPAHEGVNGLGASFIRHDTSLEPRLGERQENLQKLGESLSECHWHQELAVADESRVSIRATLRDHLPLAGRLDRENTPPLWLLAGLGSRGLCSAPLLGELLASELCGEPLPLPSSLLDALHPSRFAKQ